MREISRSLTIRTSISFVFLTGCAFNFGQVNASGTANVTADTKIDTTVNASASTTVTQNGNTAQQTATPAIVPTPEQKKTLTLMPNYALLYNFADFGFQGKHFLFAYYATAKGGNISFSVTYTCDGTACDSDDILTNFRQKGPDGTTIKSSLENRKVKHDIMTARDGTTEDVQIWPDGNLSDANDFALAKKYNGKTIGLSIEKLSDIELMTSNVEVKCDFPLKYPDEKKYKFCCVGR